MKRRDNNSLVAPDIAGLPAETLHKIAFAMPWSPALKGSAKDADGFSEASSVILESQEGLKDLQVACWNKFLSNPQVSSSVRDTAGAVAGAGFSVDSRIKEIRAVVKEVMFDTRNFLQKNAKKHVARGEIDGELFLCLTLHDDGFVEIDFVDPKSLQGGTENGVITHPDKPTFPLAYEISRKNVHGGESSVIIPSINIAYYPDQIEKLKACPKYNDALSRGSRSLKRKYAKTGGFFRFIISWDKSLFTLRNVGHLRSTLEWINLYENLKKYEIDHKKSSGSYLWVAQFTDMRSFQTWLSLTEEQKAQTGLLQSKTPGGTLILPPGMELECKNPQLPKISDEDTDILQMITSGLNKPEDQVTGQSKGTFASVKASRGPQTDRIENDKEDYKLFLQYDLFRAVFYLKNLVDPSFKLTYKVKTATSFDDKREPVFEELEFYAHELLDITMPSTALADAEGITRALLGVKHGSLADTLGIPLEFLAKKLGFANYHSLRLAYATEKETLPDVQATIDAEQAQELAISKADGAQRNASEGGNPQTGGKKPMPKKDKSKADGGKK